jgi:dTDP-glucose pyrophosphorylase
MQIVYLAGNGSSTQDDSGVSKVKLDYFNQLCTFAEVVVVSHPNFLNFLKSSEGDFVVRDLHGETRGALVSASFALGDLDSEASFLVIPSNSVIPLTHISQFIESMTEQECAVGAMVLQSTDPKYSYARKDKANNVVEIVEKQVAGNCALAGIYYFDSPKVFQACAQWALVNNITNEGQYFLSPALNYFLASGIEIGLYEIPSKDYLRFDTRSKARASIERWDQLNGTL